MGEKMWSIKSILIELISCLVETHGTIDEENKFVEEGSVGGNCTRNSFDQTIEEWRRSE